MKKVAGFCAELEMIIVETQANGAVVIRSLKFDRAALCVEKSRLSALYFEHLRTAANCTHKADEQRADGWKAHRSQISFVVCVIRSGRFFRDRGDGCRALELLLDLEILELQRNICRDVLAFGFGFERDFQYSFTVRKNRETGRVLLFL